MSGENKTRDAIEKLRGAEALIREAISLFGGASTSVRSPRSTTAARKSTAAVRFDMNERAFVKNVARRQSGGPRRFVALLAYLAKGSSDKEIAASDVQKIWNRNSSKTMLASKYHPEFLNRAKAEGWVNPKKRGVLVLDRSWREALTSE